MHQAWVTCPPPAETDVHPTGTRWGRGMGAQFPRVKTEGHKPSKEEQMPNKKNPLKLRVLVLSWVTHWLAIYDTFRIVIFLYSMRLAFRNSELSWGFSILPNIVDSKFVFLQTCLSHTSASSEGCGQVGFNETSFAFHWHGLPELQYFCGSNKSHVACLNHHRGVTVFRKWCFRHFFSNGQFCRLRKDLSSGLRVLFHCPSSEAFSYGLSELIPVRASISQDTLTQQNAALLWPRLRCYRFFSPIF